MTTNRDRHHQLDPTTQRDVVALDRMLSGPPERRGGDVHRAPMPAPPRGRSSRRTPLGVTDADVVRDLDFGA